MLDIAQKLSIGFPILRVDLYEVNGKVYFGELTLLLKVDAWIILPKNTLHKWETKSNYNIMEKLKKSFSCFFYWRSLDTTFAYSEAFRKGVLRRIYVHPLKMCYYGRRKTIL
mgnify:CR=1 FL=1